MVELAMIRGMIEKHEIFFQSQQGKDISHLSTEVKGLKKMIVDLKTKIGKKDDEMNYSKPQKTLSKSRCPNKTRRT